jgi:hypothetical protein
MGLGGVLGLALVSRRLPWSNQQQQNQKQPTHHSEIPNSTSHATQASLWLPQARAQTECCQYLACSSVDSSGLANELAVLPFLLLYGKEDVLQFIASHTSNPVLLNETDWIKTVCIITLSICVAVMDPF